MYILHFVYPLCCFHVLAIVNNATMNECTNICGILVFNSLECIPRSRLPGWCRNPLFNFLRNCHTIFHSSCICLHSHQQCMRIPISPHLGQQFLFSVFACLLAVKWCFTVVLVHMSLMISDVEHFFMCLLAICNLLWKNVSSSSLLIFKN